MFHALRNAVLAGALFFLSFLASAQIPMLVEATTQQLDGKIVAAGQSTAATPERRITIVRFHSDGTLDANFGSNGSTDFLADDPNGVVEFRATAVTVSSVGKILIAAVRNGEVALIRLAGDGIPDSSFGTTVPGFVLDVGSTDRRVKALVADSAGVTAVGSYDYGSARVPALYRYDEQGQRDPAFGPLGQRTYAVSTGDAELRAAVALGDGSIVGAGYARGAAEKSFLITKMLPSGDLDATFGTSGFTILPSAESGYDSEAFTLTRDDASGRYVVSGRCFAHWSPYSYAEIRLLSADGTPDSSFGHLGRANLTSLSQKHSTIIAAAMIPSTTDLIMGESAIDSSGYSLFAQVRFSLATAFAAWGPYLGPIPTANQVDHSLAGVYPDASGRFLVVGTREAPEGTTAYRARHFLDNGEIDTDFPTEGVDETPNTIYASFYNDTSAAPSTTYQSNTIRISGINVPVSISVDGGEYSIGCNGTRTSAPGTIVNGETVCLFNTSASTPNTTTTAVLSVGTRQFAFSVITGDVPDTTITAKPPNPSVATVSFQYSSPRSSGFECSLDGGAFSACSSSGITYSNLPDAVHTFQVRALNAWGPDPTPATYSWATIRESDTTINSKPASTSGVNVNFTFSSPNPGATFECRIDSAAFAACTSPRTYVNLANGIHSFQVRSKTVAGYDPTPARYSWRVDGVIPDTTLTNGPPKSSTSTNATFAFISTKTPATFECKLDQGAFAACTSPTALSNLVRGMPHTFYVRAIDSVGNVDPTPASYTWFVIQE